MAHDKKVLEQKYKAGGYSALTKGERIAATRHGIMPVIRSERERQLRARYGLTLEDYEKKFNDQDQVCRICNKPWHNDLYVDHDHQSGRVRDLLCRKCNTIVGYVEEDLDLVTKAMIYLALHESQRNYDDATGWWDNV